MSGVKGIMVNVLVSRVWGVPCILYIAQRASLNTHTEFTHTLPSPTVTVLKFVPWCHPCLELQKYKMHIWVSTTHGSYPINQHAPSYVHADLSI